jgi:high-affinity Fe2+/Pb2+ permease
MFEKIKQQPLVGLALAICVGYVTAHLIIKTGDNLYKNSPGRLALVVVAALFALAFWQRWRVLSWLRGHKKIVAACVLSVLLACSALTINRVLNERKAAAEYMRWEAQWRAQVEKDAAQQHVDPEILAMQRDPRYQHYSPGGEPSPPVTLDFSKAIPISGGKP